MASKASVRTSTVTVTTVAQKVLDANTERKFLGLQNKSEANTILVKFGGDFTAAVNEVQKVSFLPALVPSAGSFKLKYGATKTGAIAYTADDAAVQTALRLVAGLETVTVDGNFVDGFTVTFGGDAADKTLLEVTDNTLTSDDLRTDEVQNIVFSAVPTAGTFKIKSGAEKTSALAFDVDAAAVQTALRLLTGLSAVTVAALIEETGFAVTFAGSHADAAMLEVTDSTLTDETVETDEVQTIYANMIPTEGSFRLQFGDQITAELAYGATSAQIQTALRALSNISNDTTVTGADLVAGMVVTFTGADGNVDQPMIQPYLVDLKRHGEVLRMDAYEGAPGVPAGTVTATVAEATKGVGDQAQAGSAETLTGGVAYQNEGTTLEPGDRISTKEAVFIDEVWAICDDDTALLEIMEG